MCEDKENVTYCIEELHNKKVGVRVGKQLLTSAQVSARILEKLKQDAESMLGGRKIRRAVITVPAYFNESQRQATKEAGELAGLSIPRIINEPTAAALAFGLGSEPQTVAVYDMGGGTFDISILEISHGLFRVKATGGDTHLGGNDFDMAIVEWLKTAFERQHGQQLPVKDNNLIRARLRNEAEKAKIALSGTDTYRADMQALMTNGKQTLGLDATLGRSDLESLIQPFISRSLEICEGVVREARLSPDKISQVLLIGGQTRTPGIKKALRDRFGWHVNDSVNPDEVVARGAAVQGARLCGHLRDQVRLWDVIPLSLGIELFNGKMDTIIQSNTHIPITKWRRGSHAFSTQRDGQERIRFNIFQGERPVAADNFLLGEVVLNLATSRPAGEHRISCMFKVDIDGILHVRAEDAETEGEPVEKTFDRIYRITPEEVEEMLRDADVHMSDDNVTRRIFEIEEELAHIRKGIETSLPEKDLQLRLEKLETAMHERDADKAEQILAGIRECM